MNRIAAGVLSTRPTTAAVTPIAISGETPSGLLDLGYHRVRQAGLAEFREVLNDDELP